MNELAERIAAIKERLEDLPAPLGKNPFPLRHLFADGLYIREITVPAGALTVTAMHKKEHVTVILKGRLSILENCGTRVVEAPDLFITPAGTRRAIYHHTEVVLTTIHANPDGERNIEVLEKRFAAFDPSDMEDGATIEITAEGVKKL
jgi:mannose-6-phosphate isomerase-like protein (cupin superfamily)